MRRATAVVLAALLGPLAGCGSQTTPAAVSSPAAAAEPSGARVTRFVLERRLEAFEEQLDEGVPRTLELLNSSLDVTPTDDAEALVRLGEELSDWIDDEREWLAAQAPDPCVAVAVAAYAAAVDELGVVVNRLFEAPEDAGSAAVRAEAANEDTRRALSEAQAALPDDCP